MKRFAKMDGIDLTLYIKGDREIKDRRLRQQVLRDPDLQLIACQI
jgi:hypothetical protein